MKELSNAEKAQAYDKIREKIALRFGSNVADEIFSQFEMSEDERIRKALIDYFRWNPNSQLLNEFTNREVFAWLEKQNSNVDNANKEYWRGYREGKQEILDKYAELEKQGEKPQGKSALEAAKEEKVDDQNCVKLADKPEPKFKVGYKVYDLRNGFECTIESIDETTYYGDTTNFDIKDQDNWELVEQNPFDGGCVAEVYKNRRDRISISDITQWCYLYDLHKLSNIEKTEKCGKEEPVSEDLGEYINELSKQFPEVSFAKLSRIAVRVAKWKEEQMMEKAIDVEVKVDAGGYPYIPQMELYDYDKDVPLAKAGDRYKVILIKEE